MVQRQRRGFLVSRAPSSTSQPVAHIQSQLTSTEHLNLPNFDTVSQLAYPECEDEGKKIPDLTIGLHSYNLTEWSEIDALLHNDRVRLFDQKLLRQLENENLLIPPFVVPGSSRTRVSDMSLTFPFGFWEAKREGGGYDHQSAQKQNARKVKMILDWQDEVRKKAEVPWLPLVWYFVSVGSKWEIHACHLEENSRATEGRICVRSPPSPLHRPFAHSIINFRYLQPFGLATLLKSTQPSSFCISLISLRYGGSRRTSRSLVHASSVCEQLLRIPHHRH